MAGLALKAIAYGAEKIPDSFFEKIPGGFYKEKAKEERDRKDREFERDRERRNGDRSRQGRKSHRSHTPSPDRHSPSDWSDDEFETDPESETERERERDRRSRRKSDRPSRPRRFSSPPYNDTYSRPRAQTGTLNGSMTFPPPPTGQMYGQSPRSSISFVPPVAPIPQQAPPVANGVPYFPPPPRDEVREEPSPYAQPRPYNPADYVVEGAIKSPIENPNYHPVRPQQVRSQSLFSPKTIRTNIPDPSQPQVPYAPSPAYVPVAGAIPTPPFNPTAYPSPPNSGTYPPYSPIQNPYAPIPRAPGAYAPSPAFSPPHYSQPPSRHSSQRDHYDQHDRQDRGRTHSESRHRHHYNDNDVSSSDANQPRRGRSESRRGGIRAKLHNRFDGLDGGQKTALPAAIGAFAGGLVGSSVGPVGTVIGATLGGMGGTALERRHERFEK